MAILIKGMEMPTERESFNLTIKYNGTVLDTETGMQVAEAYELPPYGRCINADRIRTMSIEEIENWFWWMHKEMMRYTDSRVFLHDWLRQEAE